jgi:DNA-binding GntR family transcriptional regulator
MTNNHTDALVTASPRPAQRQVARPAPLRWLVLDAIVEMIINRELAPGQHLSEAELATLLGVSRQPIREALQQLDSDGWVNLRPGQGAFVHEPTDKEADDLLAVRVLLECESARQAALARTPADVARLWDLWRHGTKVAADGKREEMVKANSDLHSFITAIGGNVVLAEVAGGVERRVRWHYTPVAVERRTDAWGEHKELITAIEAGDASLATELMRAHTERTRLTIHEHR